MAVLDSNQVIKPRNVQGDLESPTMTVAVGTRSVQILMAIDAADLIDTSKSFVLKVWVSKDGGATRIPYGEQSWAGGPWVDKFGNANPQPQLTVGPFDDLAGALVWAEIIAPNVIRTGATIVLVDTGDTQNAATHHSISFVGSFGYAQTTSGTSLTTPARTTVSRNSILPFISIASTAAVTFSDNRSGTGTYGSVSNPDAQQQAIIGYAHNIVGGAGHTVTGSWTGNTFARLNALEYSGMENSAPEANTGTAFASGNTATPSTGAITASVGSLCVAMVTHFGAGIAITPTDLNIGWTERTENEDVAAGQPVNIQEKISLGASENASWLLGSSLQAIVTLIAAFKELKVATRGPDSPSFSTRRNFRVLQAKKL